MKLTPPTLIAAVIAIGGAGFFIGRLSSSGEAGAGVDPADPSRPGARGSVAAAGDAGAGPGSRMAARAARGEERRSAGAGRVTGEEAMARLESIVRGENALDRSRAMLAFIDQLDPDEFESAVAHFRSLGITDSRFGEYGMLLTAWAEADPIKALDYVKANTNGGFALNTVLASWAGKDPESAISWAQSNHSGDGANPYYASIIRSLGATDPARASDLLTSMPVSRERGEALDALLPHMLRQGNEVSRDWIASISDEALRNGAMNRAAVQMAKTDPQGTASWLLANPGDALNRSLDDVVGTWAGQDEKGAVAFFNTLPKGEARTDALRGLISSVATRDPAAAAGMIDRYSGDADDGAIRSFVWHSFGSDPALAATYVGRIADAGERERTYRRTLEFWLDRDPAGAQAWMNRNALPKGVVDHFQRRAAEAARQ